MARIIVLGAGFGGIAAATRPRSLLRSSDELVLIDRRAAAVNGRFLTDPPAIAFSEPSPQGLAAKAAFEHDRLAAWSWG